MPTRMNAPSSIAPPHACRVVASPQSLPQVPVPPPTRRSTLQSMQEMPLHLLGGQCHSSRGHQQPSGHSVEETAPALWKPAEEELNYQY